MNSAWFISTFLRVLKFLQIEEGGPNFWSEQFLQKVWIISSPLLYLNFKSFVDPNSFSFITSQCILHHWGVLFSESSNFYKLKRGDIISKGNQFCKKSELFGPPFPILFYADFLSFIRFQWILYDSAVLFSESWNFYNLTRGDLISGGNQFCRKSELFGPPFCI